MAKTLKQLREEYLTLKVYISGGKAIGHGNRIIYVESCDGITVRGYTGDGQPCRVKVEHVKIEDVLSSTGNPVEWEIRGYELRACGKQVCPWGRIGKSIKEEDRDDDDGVIFDLE